MTDDRHLEGASKHTDEARRQICPGKQMASTPLNPTENANTFTSTTLNVLFVFVALSTRSAAPTWPKTSITAALMMKL